MADDADTMEDTATAAPEAAPDGQPAIAADKPSEAPVAPKTLAEDAGDEKPGVPADWPDDWRAKVAGDDAKFLKRLERMQSPADVAKAWRSLEAKMSSGEMKAPLGKDATPDQVAAWRKDNGIPDAPDGYLAKLPDGIVLGDADKPYALDFAAKMHDLNAPPEIVAQAIAWDRQRQEKVAEDQREHDKAARAETEDGLRAEWGADYRGNLNAIQNYLDATSPGDDPSGASFKDMILGARIADGTPQGSPMGNNPLFLRWLASQASEYNPAGTVVPGVGGSQASSIDDEIKAIEGTMRTDRAAYNKDAAMQARLRTLYEAQEKMKSRAS